MSAERRDVRVRQGAASWRLTSSQARSAVEQHVCVARRDAPGLGLLLLGQVRAAA